MCSKSVGFAAAVALAMTAFISPVANAAGTTGCYAYTAAGGHQLGSFCPVSSSPSLHRAGGRFYFDSGYSTDYYTAWANKGVYATTAYVHGGTVTSKWQEFRN